MAKNPVVASDADIIPAARPDPEVAAIVRRAITQPGLLLPEKDSENMAAEIIGRMMAAATEEELDSVLASRLHPITGSRDGELPPLTGMPLRVHQVGFNNGDEQYQQDNRIAIYAVLEVETQDGRRILASCGGQSVVAYFAKRWEEGWLPVDVVISPSDKVTKAGYRPLNVRRTDWKRVELKDGEEPF